MPKQLLSFSCHSAFVAVCAVSYFFLSCGGSGVQVASQKQTLVLALTSVSPPEGSSVGGTAVTLHGKAFSNGVQVSFGGDLSTSVVVISSAEIRALAPPHAPGTVEVKISNTQLQEASIPQAFKYVATPALESVTPNSGLTSGGTQVTILGSNFVPGVTIRFGSEVARDVEVVSTTVIRAVTPPQAPGIVDIKIDTPDALSFVLNKSFRYGRVLFADGFESGDFSAWKSAGKYSCSTYGSSFAVSTTRVHSGADSAEFRYRIPSDQCSSSQDNNVVAVQSFDANNGYPNGLEHFFVRGYVNFKTPEPGGSKDKIQRKLYYIASSPSPSDWSFMLTSDGISGQLIVRFSTNGNSYVAPYTFWDLASLNYDKWYCLELEVLLSTPGLSNGRLALWIDGEQVFQETGVDLRGPYTGGAKMVLVGMQANRTQFLAVDEYRYWDDVIIADAYIGP